MRALVVDSTQYDTFVENVVRLTSDTGEPFDDGTGTMVTELDTRVQFDGTLPDLQAKVQAFVQKLVAPPLVNEADVGTTLKVANDGSTASVDKSVSANTPALGAASATPS